MRECLSVSSAHRTAVANIGASSPIILAPNVDVADLARWSGDGGRLLMSRFSDTATHTTRLYITRPDGSDGYVVLQATTNPFYPNWNRRQDRALDGEPGVK